MKGKKEFLASGLHFSGLTSIASRLTKRNLLIANYHRLYKASLCTKYDEGVFAHSEETFFNQLVWLKKNFDVVSESELIAITQENRDVRENIAHVTFDDGYSDCYDIAFPILKQLNLPATFFIPFYQVDKGELGWWDSIAYLVKKTGKNQIEIGDVRFVLGSSENRTDAISAILSSVKESSIDSSRKILDKLSIECDVLLPSAEEQRKEFMTWDMIKELNDNGMSIGSHSMSHRILAQLEDSEQEWEIFESKKQLEEMLGCPILSISYPVGSRTAFNANTKKFAHAAGYKLGYTFILQHQSTTNIDPYEIRRIELSQAPLLFRAESIFPKLFYS